MFYKLKNLASINRTEEKAYSLVWELDLCSRPILDERGKKLWELLVTDSRRSFVFSEFFRNNKVNSASIKSTLIQLLESQQFTKPAQCHFFRSQSQTIVTRALNDLEIRSVPSRRCPNLMDLLEERFETVYKKHPGYSDLNLEPNRYELTTPKELPSVLKGEQWSFVQMHAEQLKKEVQAATERNSFGATSEFFGQLDRLSTVGIIPGVAVYSKRSLPLSAWTNSLELASISVDADLDSLILETGVSQRWIYGSYRKCNATNQEARAWERSKKAVEGLHFLVIQSSRNSDSVDGLWLMQTREYPPI